MGCYSQNLVFSDDVFVTAKRYIRASLTRFRYREHGTKNHNMQKSRNDSPDVQRPSLEPLSHRYPQEHDTTSLRWIRIRPLQDVYHAGVPRPSYGPTPYRGLWVRDRISRCVRAPRHRTQRDTEDEAKERSCKDGPNR